MKRRVSLGEVDLGRRELELIETVIKSNRLSYGSMTRDLEHKLAALHGVKHAVFMASGTCALQVGLEAMKEIRRWEDGAEVVIPATTFIATMSAVIHAGLKPVLCDVSAHSFNLDPDCLGQLRLTENEVAVLPVHLFGHVCQFEKIISICAKNDLSLIEDCCEAVGVMLPNGNSVPGEDASFAAISTYVCHHLSTGVGGAVLTNDSELATICRSLIQHGRDPAYLSLDDDAPETVDKKYKFVRWGHSYRATEMQAALGLAQIDTLTAARSTRLSIANDLTFLLKRFPIVLPTFSPGDSPLFYPIVMADGCSQLVVHLEECGIETRPLMPLLNQKPVRQYLDKTTTELKEEFPVAYRLIDEGFIIGCHSGMTRDDITHIEESIDEYFRWKTTHYV